ncbi:MAG: serine hydrolase domain-containing protein [Acidobacteriota bacterium]
MSPKAFLEARVAAGDLPGAAWVVARGRQVLAGGAVGAARAVPPRRPADEGTVYDLASLTKPLATAVLAVLLARDGVVGLDGPVGDHLPELGSSPYARATLLDLLVHRCGLPAWEPLYLHGSDPPSYLRRLARLPPAGPPGGPAVYSDLGYLAAGILLERASGHSLETLFRTRILDSLPGPAPEVCFLPPPAWRPRIAPTERGSRHDREMTASLAGEAAARDYRGWRHALIEGEVHDQNAWVAGGVCGHAGLFGTAAGVARLGAEFLAGSRLFTSGELDLFQTSRIDPGPPRRSLGFEVGGEAAGRVVSPRTFGQVGFTGTSLFVDPSTQGVYVLLANRVHPEHREIAMKALRSGFHDRAARRLGPVPDPTALE